MASTENHRGKNLQSRTAVDILTTSHPLSRHRGNTLKTPVENLVSVTNFYISGVRVGT